MNTNTAIITNENRMLAPIMEARDLVLDTRHTQARAIMNAAQVDWRVTKRPLFLGDGRVMPGAFGLTRDDTGAPLSVVGNKYTVHQNTQGLDAFDRAVESGILRGYSNAGTFGGGKLVFIQAELGDPFDVGGDEIKRYLTLTISHGSRMVDMWKPTTIRVVCKNTFMLSREAAGGLSMRHDSVGAVLYANAIETIKRASASLDAWRDRAEVLARKQMTTSDMRAFAETLFPTESEKASTRLEGIRNNVIDLFETGAGNYAVRGTAWAAWNAVTEYVDHSRSTRRAKGNVDTVEDSRLASAWFGSGAALKTRAFEMLA